MTRRIPYGRQSITQEDLDAVTEVLRSDFLTQGPAIERFEKQVAEYCGAKYAVAVCNATAALHLACLAAGLKNGDTLWTSPNTFVASANCALYCGAHVDFVDIDSRTLNMSADKLETKLKFAQTSGDLPAAVLPVHFAGQSCDMEKIHRLSKQYGFTVIEDASHAVGGSYKGRKVGSCTFSDMAVFSFHPVKIITTGEGGMILTNREDLYKTLVRLRSHGITRDPTQMKGPSEGAWYYQQIDLGFNFRSTDIQSALGSSQLSRIDAFISRRHELVARYNQALAGLPLVLPWQAPDTFSAFHLYVVRVEGNNGRREVFDAMRAAGVDVNVHYIPVHLQPYYADLGFKAGDFPEAERYYQNALTLPLYYGLTDADQDRIINFLKDALKEAL